MPVVKYVFLSIFLFSNLGLSGQQFREVKFQQVDSLLNAEHETLKVVNFWATWCKPCVEELPYFQEAGRKFQKDGVQFIFISLDFQGQIESKMVPFLGKNPLPGDVWWLNERKLHTMIDKVDKKWSGAIPITIFLKGNVEEKLFWEGELDQEKLEGFIIQKL
jgi:thiol-disulfide isomerase/thioredoxin